MNREDFYNVLESLNIANEGFWKFLENKVHVFPSYIENFWWGCFPKLDENNILIDITLVVPKITDEKSFKINIHEYAHAFELYQKLGSIYDIDINKSEEFARCKEKEYKKD